MTASRSVSSVTNTMPQEPSLAKRVGKAILITALGAIAGLGATALLAASAFVVPFVIAGSAVLTLVGHVGLPRLARYIIEKKIKNELDHPDVTDPERLKLKRWLAIANKGQFEPEHWWKYTFSNGRSLMAYASETIVERNARYHQLKTTQPEKARAFRLAEQSCYREIFVLQKMTQSRTTKPFQSATLSWWDRAVSRVLIWFKGSSSINKNQTTFYEDPKNIFPALKPTLPTTQEPAIVTETKEVKEEMKGESKNQVTPTLSLPVEKKLVDDKTEKSTTSKEKYSPAEIAGNLALINSMMSKEQDQPINAEQKQKDSNTSSTHGNIPPHLNLWVTSLEMQRQVNLNREQEQTLERGIEKKREVEHKADIDFKIEMEQDLMLGDQAASESSQAITFFKGIGFQSTVRWIYRLERTLASQLNRKDAKFILEIADNAKDVLHKCNDFVRTGVQEFDLDNLPPGFYIETIQSDSEISPVKIQRLCYSVRWLEYQKQNPEKFQAVLLGVVPDTVPQAKYDYSAWQIRHADLLTTMKERNFNLNTDQLNWLLKADSKRVPIAQACEYLREATLGELMFPALDRIAKVTTEENFRALITALSQLDRRVIPEYKCGETSRDGDYGFGPKLWNLSDFFAHFYLQHLTEGQLFATAKQVEQIAWVAKLDDNALQWFYALSRGYQSRYHGNLSETCRLLKTALTFFKGKLPPRPDFLIQSGTALSNLQTLLDCFSIIRSKKTEAEESEALQMKMLQQLPMNLTRAKKLLPHYSFIHRGMQLDVDDPFGAGLGALGGYFPQIKDRLFITQEEFAKADVSKIVQNGIFSRDIKAALIALCLRYIANNVCASHAEAAIIALEKAMSQSRDQWHGRFSYEAATMSGKDWEQLKRTILTFPHKLSETVEEKVSPTPQMIVKQGKAAESFANKHIPDDKRITKLLEQLSTGSKLVSDTKDDLRKQINAFYAEVSKLQMSSQAKNIASLLAKQKDILSDPNLSAENRLTRVIESLALISYAHYLETRNNQREGQFLRLEQLISILISLQHNVLLQIETSEGKTLILQMLAYLHALQGKKVNLLTHNTLLADAAATNMTKLASYLGLKVAQGDMPVDHVIKSDIYVIDIATAVMEQKHAQFLGPFNIKEEEKKEMKRETKISVEPEGKAETKEEKNTTSVQPMPRAKAKSMPMLSRYSGLNVASAAPQEEEAPRRAAPKKPAPKKEMPKHETKQSFVLEGKTETKREEKTTGPKRYLIRGDRIAQVGLCDEVDICIGNMLASTSMQISRSTGEADKAMQDFLYALNEAVRNHLANQSVQDREEKRTSETMIRAQHRVIVTKVLEEKLVGNNFYEQRIKDEPLVLDDWIRAAVTAMGLEKHKDYIVGEQEIKMGGEKIKRKAVYIVQKETTGEIDLVSQWSQGVHSCVAAWEMSRSPDNKEMIIPGIGELLAESDPCHHMQSYEHCVGVSGTLGSSEFRGLLENNMSKIPISSVFMPRAERVQLDAVWPQVPLSASERNSGDEQKKTRTLYNRRVDFAPREFTTPEKHFNGVLNAIKAEQASDGSVLIFFDTIAAAHDFQIQLSRAGIADHDIQIFDGTNDLPGMDDSTDPQNDSRRFHTPKNLVIEQAKQPRKITLTTLAGSRGVDFDNVSLGLMIHPMDERAMIQAPSRIARNGQKGRVEYLFLTSDLEKAKKAISQQQEKNAHEIKAIESGRPNVDKLQTLRSGLISSPNDKKNVFAKYADMKICATILRKQALRCKRQALLNQYIAYRCTQPSEQHHELDKRWTVFFSRFDKESAFRGQQVLWNHFTKTFESDMQNAVVSDARKQGYVNG